MRIFTKGERLMSADDSVAAEAIRLRARIRYFLEELRRKDCGETLGEEGENAARVDCARFSLGTSAERRDDRLSSRLGSENLGKDDSDDDDLLSMWIED